MPTRVGGLADREDTLSTETELSESDSELIARFQAGDRSAFAALVRRWEGPLVRIAYRITGDLAEAEDLRQRVLLGLLESPGSVRSPDRFAAWIRRAIVNQALTALRGRRRRERFDRRLRGHAPAAADADPGEALVAGDQARRLADALLRLDPRERALLSLRFDEDLTFSEIAAALGQPVTTVKSRVARAIDRLRVLLNSGQ
jgi:RNA polymerase sigma-70 factor (ECF subfamily)